MSLVDLYRDGFNLTVPLAVETGNTFMGIAHYRSVIKPFENAVTTGLDTHLAARATATVDMDPNIHHEQPICSC